MFEKIAYRVSASVLMVAALAIVAMLVMGLTRADAGRSAVPAKAVVADNAVPEPVVQNMAKTDPIAADPVDIAEKLPLSDKFVVKRILQIDEPFVHGYYKWDDEGVPEGELVVISRQRAFPSFGPVMKSARR